MSRPAYFCHFWLSLWARSMGRSKSNFIAEEGELVARGRTGGHGKIDVVSHSACPVLVSSAASLVIRRAEAREAGALTELCRTAKRHWGYPSEWMARWTSDLLVTPAAIGAQWICVGEEAGRVVGFLGLRRDEVDATRHLEHLWLEPAHIGRDRGRELFNAAVRLAHALGARELHLKADPNAEPFHRRMGAVRRSSQVYELCGVRREVPLKVCSVPPRAP